jgi:hypothetical protein
MDIMLHDDITVKDLVDGYVNNDEEGVTGFHGKLNIRPKYQREFIYDAGPRQAVIDTIFKGFPLNVMYWVDDGDGTYELLDGQQRTMSICEYVKGNFSIDSRTFFNLTEAEKEKVLGYKLMIYICKGTDRERLDWFRIINIAGKPLTPQELRNATYTGPWLSDAKKHFSKTGCAAYTIASDYVSGAAIRQEYLETAIRWAAAKDDGCMAADDPVSEYMSKHQSDPNANELWLYFKGVIDWVRAVFPTYRHEMKGIEWGYLYNAHGAETLDSAALEAEAQRLMEDDDVTSKKGIYEYLLDHQEKHLSLRAFSPAMKRTAYERQRGICPACGKHFAIEEMEGDHITPWSRGGKTEEGNCQMLCKDCNRRKSDI